LVLSAHYFELFANENYRTEQAEWGCCLHRGRSVQKDFARALDF
jgi:hypothetical protein